MHTGTRSPSHCSHVRSGSRLRTATHRDRKALCFQTRSCSAESRSGRGIVQASHPDNSVNTSSVLHVSGAPFCQLGCRFETIIHQRLLYRLFTRLNASGKATMRAKGGFSFKTGGLSTIFPTHSPPHVIVKVGGRMVRSKPSPRSPKPSFGTDRFRSAAEATPIARFSEPIGTNTVDPHHFSCTVAGFST